MAYENIREEELKNRIAQDYFTGFDCNRIIGNIDFCVALQSQQAQLYDAESLLWAEAKRGKSDVHKSIVQLILTIGKARTFDEKLPPALLGAFDAEKIAFVPYSEIHDIFYQNDFNWNIAPSNHETKEFNLVLEKVKSSIEQRAMLFYYDKHEQELKNFIQNNLVVGKFGFTKTQIDKNNFIAIFNKWNQEVKPTIVMNWDMARKKSIVEADFYLADLLSAENKTLKEKLFVVLNQNRYELDKKLNDMGIFDVTYTKFNDHQKAHTAFWNKYERPPKEEYWDYIIERRDLLVPQDVRERKGSFFTPQIWVERSQEYLTDVLGEDWQDEYYVWDCAAGTGNLLTGLTNKYHVWASTLDRQDVDVVKDRIANGANLLEDHVFQFDFLNDDFKQLPEGLQRIINDPEKRKKLVIYINPPYVEGDARIGKGRRDVQKSRIHEKYQNDLGKASGELFAQFFIRIYREIEGCYLAEFSKLKHLQAPNFLAFRQVFQAKLEKMFVVPADTFDNVKGQFPIGFMIWNTQKKEIFKRAVADVYDAKGKLLAKKKIHSYGKSKLLSALITQKKSEVDDDNAIGYLSSTGNDFQNQRAVFIDDYKKRRKAGGRHTIITSDNLITVAVYYAVRKAIPATWLNDRDQFLYPNKKWEADSEFQNDCLTYTLFDNNIQSEYGTNHWIPFTEYQVDARTKFESDFMTKFIAGKIKTTSSDSLLGKKKALHQTPLEFSAEAKAVFEAGKALWQYYHAQPNPNVNASFYDIRAHFQGRNGNGRMKSHSDDAKYNELLAALREQIKILAQKIEPKIYEYEFLKD
ncbi:MAG: hypothetical protein JJT94_13195 [Bernardetiaceae bacterium]|nr:hypothetical protein [Bernardetiaceae bacterium]